MKNIFLLDKLCLGLGVFICSSISEKTLVWVDEFSFY